MKIKLSTQQMVVMAEEFAKEIHGEVVLMHLRRSWGSHPWDEIRECIYDREKSQGFRDVQEAIRSVTDRLDRINLVAQVRFHFNRLCAERGTHRKWQDYVVSVQRHAQEERRRAA